MRVCVLSVSRDCMDDRLFHKETRSIARRHKVTLVAPAIRGDTPSVPDMEYRPIPTQRGIVGRFLSVPAALRATLGARPDVVHFHDYELVFAIPLLKALTHAKVIYDVWEANYEMMVESRKLPRWIARLVAVAFRTIERRLCRYCDLVVTADCEIAKVYRDVAHVVVVKNYPIIATCTPNPERVLSLKKMYDGRRCIVYVGSMAEERGLYLMLEIVALLREDVPNVALLLVGQLDDSQRARVARTIREKALELNVDAVGWVPFGDVVNYIAISEIGLIPFLRTAKFMKNIPQKQFEYMFCGIPVVGTDLPPISQYVREAGCGLLVSEPRPEDFAKTLVNLLENDAERRIMGLRGKQAVAEKWNWDKAEQRLLAAYDEMGAQSRRRPDAPRQRADARSVSR
ncbi:MAG TPA: glycosyltransferase family 4 protein [bacterium]|nr:glycosyltransferase family 4 protein [bacterium]